MALTENELTAYAGQFRTLKVRQAALKKEIEGIKEILIREMQARNETCHFAGDYKILCYDMKRSVFDTKRFKSAEPNFYGQYLKDLVETRLEVA